MKKTALLIMVLTIISKVFGFTRDITLSYFYGATNISDAYLIALTIPTTLLSLVGIGIGTGYIPLYSEIEQKYGNGKSNEFTNNVINISLVLCTIIIILGLNFTDSLVKIFASGFDEATSNIAVSFTQITLFGIYFTLISYIFRPYLQLHNNYYIPALVSLPLNVFMVLSIVISSYTDIIWLPIGSLIAIASQLLILLPYVMKTGFRYKGVIKLTDSYIKKMLFIALPVIAGVSVNQINVLVDRTIASRISIGGISALNYSNQINQFIQAIFVMSFATVMYPHISKMVANNNMLGLKNTMSESINGIILLLLPATIGAMIFAIPIVNLLFGRGAFNEQAVYLTGNGLFYYSLGMVGFGLREVLSRVFYAMQDTKTPMINASIGVSINIILNIILSRYLGIGGLALATSIAATITTVLLFISLRKKIGPFGMKQISISFLKILFASLVMGGLAKLSFNLLISFLPQNLSLLMAIVVGAISYFVIIYFMKIEDVDVIVGAIKKKFGRGAAPR